MCSTITRLKKEISESIDLEDITGNVWWTLQIKHIPSGRAVYLRYNSLWIEYWFLGTVDRIPTGTQNMLRYDEDVMLDYLRTGK